MSIVLSSSTEITLMLIGLLILAIISWRRLDWGVCLVALCLPFYLLKVKIDWLPTNVLELMILVLVLVFCLSAYGRPAGGWRQTRPPLRPSSSPNRGERSGASRRGLFRRVGGARELLLPTLLILIGTIMATLNSSNLEVSAGILRAWFLVPIVFALIVATVTNSKKQLKNFSAALVISGATVALVALWYFFHGWLSHDGRLSAFYLSPNHLAMYLSPIFIISFGLWFFIEKKWLRVFLLVISFLLLVVIYLTYSYGAWLGLVVALLVLLILNQRQLPTKKKKRLRLFSLFLIFLIIVLFCFQLSSEKFNNLLKFTRSSFQSRLMIWRTALLLIKDYPILGIGPGMFQEYYLARQTRFLVPYLEWAVPQPHNLFLAFWLQTGLLGLVGFFWLLVEFFKKIFKLMATEPLAAILIAVMIYMLIHGLLDTTYWKNDLAIIFWTVVAWAVIIQSYTTTHRVD